MHDGTELLVSSSDESEDSDNDNKSDRNSELIKEAKATPNKFSFSHPGLRNICIRAGSPFPLFYLYDWQLSSHYFPGTTIKHCIKACLSSQPHF